MCATNSLSSFTKWTHFHKDDIGLTNNVSKNSNNSRTLSNCSLKKCYCLIPGPHCLKTTPRERRPTSRNRWLISWSRETPVRGSRWAQGVECWRSTSCHTRTPSVCPSSLPAQPSHPKTCTDHLLHQSTSLSWNLRRSPKEYVQINRRFSKSLRTYLRSPNLSVLTSGHLVLYPQHVSFHTPSGVEREEWM